MKDYEEQKGGFERGNNPEGCEDVEEPEWKSSQGADDFMAFEEYAKYGEGFTALEREDGLLAAYNELMEAPAERCIEASPSTKEAIQNLGWRANARGFTNQRSSMDSYWG